MGHHSSRGEPNQIENLSKNLLIQLAFPQVGQKFEKAEFFYKSRQMKIYIPVEHRNLIREWSCNIDLFTQDEIKKYILLPKSYQFQQQGYCGSSGVAKVFLNLFRKIIYDYFPYSLEGEIENRKKSIDNEQFSEPQIWKILYVVLKAANFMHKNWKKTGDIRPKNILYNQEKQLRISSQFSYPRQLTNFQKFLFEKQNAYLAPEELHDIKMGRIQPKSSRNAKQHIIESESWSVGLTLLHITLLFNFQKIYDSIKLQINHQLLQQKVLDLQNKKNLSEALKNIIKSMLEQIPQRRLLSSQLLLNHLLPFQQSILKLESFNKTKLNVDIKELMIKKSENSLIGTIWKACSNGLIESLVVNKKEGQNFNTQDKAKQTLLQQLQKFSQIPPMNSQVSIRQSIKLGSKKKMAGSNLNIQQSQVSSESFHTVGSLQFSKSGRNVQKRIGFEIQNRFLGYRYPTSGSNFSPTKVQNFQNISDKFMTPLQQSSYFQTIQANERSFDFNSLGPLNSTFRFSQAIDDKNFLEKIEEKLNESRKIKIQGNFKKEKSKQKK